MTKRPRKAGAGGEQVVPDDVPCTMLLPDRRTVLVLVPDEECVRDVSGEILLKPQAVRRLDRVRVMAMNLPRTPTPGFAHLA